MVSKAEGFSCKILADSRHPNGNRLTTMELRYPRIVHSELLTHRRKSRNSASSRAIPIRTMLDDVQRDPFLPIHWGAAQAGMQAYEEVSPEIQEIARAKILAHMEQAVQLCKELNELGLAKQLVNRYIEPWMWITIVATNSTAGWANFFALRCHPMAEPHIRRIADMAKDAMIVNKENVRSLMYGEWHLPLIGFPGDEEIVEADLPKVSAARAARVSYLTHEGKRDVEKDLDLYYRLAAQDPKHASALEHPAQCIHLSPNMTAQETLEAMRWSGNYEQGWRQLRKMIPNEACDKLDFER